MHGCDAKLVQYVAGVMVMFFFFLPYLCPDRPNEVCE